MQYDSVDGDLNKFLETELLPRVEKIVKLRADAYSRAIVGTSSGV